MTDEQMILSLRLERYLGRIRKFEGDVYVKWLLRRYHFKAPYYASKPDKFGPYFRSECYVFRKTRRKPKRNRFYYGKIDHRIKFAFYCRFSAKNRWVFN